MSDDVISHLGQNLDFMEAQISPSTVVADKETGEDQLYRPCLPQYPSLPSTDLGTGSQFGSDMPDVSNRQTLPTMGCDVETNGGLSNLNNKLPTGFGVQDQERVLEGAPVAVKAPVPAPVIIRQQKRTLQRRTNEGQEVETMQEREAKGFYPSLETSMAFLI